MKISENGLNLIKKYEGCRLSAYKPVASETYYTIGWGHYGADVTANMKITQERADELLRQDLVRYEKYVNSICAYLTLNQNQFDALVSFTYNCGAGSLSQITGKSTRSTVEISNRLELYVKGGGKTLPGLVKRRAEEKVLFNTPIIEETIEEEEMRYNNINDIPEYAKSTIQKLIDKNLLHGDENGLNLSEDMIRMFVVMDRAGIYD